MSDKQGATPAVDVPSTFPDCPHWGKGGRYALDIANGCRVPVEEVEANAAPDDAIDAPSDAGKTEAKPVKEKKRA